MFIAALFTTGSNPKSSLTDEWVKKTYSAMEDYSSIKKKETMLLAAVCIQIEIVILSKITVKHRKTNTI